MKKFNIEPFLVNGKVTIWIYGILKNTNLDRLLFEKKADDFVFSVVSRMDVMKEQIADWAKDGFEYNGRYSFTKLFSTSSISDMKELSDFLKKFPWDTSDYTMVEFLNLVSLDCDKDIFDKLKHLLGKKVLSTKQIKALTALYKD